MTLFGNLSRSLPYRKASDARKKQSGITLVEIAIGLGVAALAAATMAEQMADGTRTVRSSAVANKMNEIYRAADMMVAENFDALLAAAGAGTPLVIPVAKGSAGGAIPSGPGSIPSLQEGGYLSPSFIDRNSYNQRHAVLIRQPNPAQDRLSVIVTSWDGNPIEDQMLARISGFIGAHGGIMLEEPPGGAPDDEVMGSFGGWQTPATTWDATWSGNDVGPSTSRVMAHFTMSRDERGVRVNEMLHRVEIPGQPELNEMNTDMSLGNNNIDNINNFNAQTGDVNSDLDVGNNLTVGNNTDVTNNVDIGNDLSVTRDTSSGRDVNAGRHSTVGSNLTVGNDAAVGNNASVGNDLQVDNNARIDGTMGVGGASPPSGSHLDRQRSIDSQGSIAIIDGSLKVNRQGGDLGGFIEMSNDYSGSRNLFICSIMNGNETTGSRRIGMHRNIMSGCDTNPLIYFEMSGPSAEDRGSAHFDGNINTDHDLTAGRDIEVGRDLSVARNADVQGELEVDGEATFHSDIYANDIQLAATTVGGRPMWASEAIMFSNIVTPGQNVPKPTCRPGMSPQIFISPVIFSDNGNGRPLLGVRAYADHSGSNWTVRLQVFTPNAAGTGVQTVNVTSSYGRIMAMAKCG